MSTIFCPSVSCLRFSFKFFFFLSSDFFFLSLFPFFSSFFFPSCVVHACLLGVCHPGEHGRLSPPEVGRTERLPLPCSGEGAWYWGTGRTGEERRDLCVLRGTQGCSTCSGKKRWFRFHFGSGSCSYIVPVLVFVFVIQFRLEYLLRWKTLLLVPLWFRVLFLYSSGSCFGFRDSVPFEVFCSGEKGWCDFHFGSGSWFYGSGSPGLRGPVPFGSVFLSSLLWQGSVWFWPRLACEVLFTFCFVCCALVHFSSVPSVFLLPRLDPSYSSGSQHFACSATLDPLSVKRKYHKIWWIPPPGDELLAPENLWLWWC